MKYENEITVEVNCNLEQLEKILTDSNFDIKEKYKIKDIYMLDKNYKTNNDYLETLKHSVLIRHIIEKEKETKTIAYKYKEYNEDKEIIKQGKINCNIESIDTIKRK